MSTDTVLSAAAAAETWFAKAAKEWGIFAAMVVFFIYWSWVRENSLTERINAQDEFIRGTLVSALDNNTKALEAFKVQLAERSRP